MNLPQHTVTLVTRFELNDLVMRRGPHEGRARAATGTTTMSYRGPRRLVIDAGQASTPSPAGRFAILMECGHTERRHLLRPAVIGPKFSTCAACMLARRDKGKEST